MERKLERLRSRRGFLSEYVAGVAAASCGWAGHAGDASAVERVELLTDYVAARDPSTAVEPVAGGEAFGGRWLSCRLTSQTWKGVAWQHELLIFLPADVHEKGPMLLWIDGGSGKNVPLDVATEPTGAVTTIAAVANAAGLPAAVVRQVPFQPMFGGLREDGLIAHTFAEFAKTGDATWPLLLPMAKSAVEAMTAAVVQTRERWGVVIEEFVVAGASKRGWTTWLAAAIDTRVKGIVPMVIDMLSLGEHVELQVASFGGMSEQLGDYTSRGIEKLLATPRGRQLVEIVDPFSYRDRYTMPKVIALGTNDPYWPLEACSLYYERLPGPRWVSYCPNAGHGLPLPRVAGLVAAVGRHVAGIEALPSLEWRFEEDGRGGVECVVRCETKPERVTLWTAEAGTRDFRGSRWSAEPSASAGPEWRGPVPRPVTGHAAALVELEFARESVPLVLTSGVKVVSAS